MKKILNNKNFVVLSNVFGSGLVKVLALVISFFTTPAYIKYFDNDATLGVWFTILSILSWILSFDLGIGNGLRNNLVRELTNNNRENIEKYVTTSYAFISKIAIVIFIVVGMIVPFLNFNKILNISSEILSNKYLILAFEICLLAIMTEFVLKLIVSILNAKQKMAIANLLSVITSSLILVFVLLFKFNNVETSLITLTIVYFFALNVPLLVATLIYFKKEFGTIKLNKKFYDKSIIPLIMKVGIAFFIIQLSLVVINSTDSFLVSNVFGSEVVVEYQKYYKLFNIIIMCSAIIAGPIWSMVTKSYVEKDYSWIKKICKIIIVLLGIIVLGLLGLNLLFDEIMHIWLKDSAPIIDNKIVFVLSFYTLIISIINFMSSIANGINALKTQFIVNLVGAIIKIPLVYFISYFINEWWIVILVNIICLLPSCIIMPFEIIAKFKKNKNKIEEN